MSLRAYAAQNVLPPATEDAVIRTIDLREPVEVSVEKIQGAAKEAGFFYLTGFATPTQSLIETVLEHIRKFTDAPKEVKSKVQICPASGNRGWGDSDCLAVPDGKEMFMVGPEEDEFPEEERVCPMIKNNLWPDAEQFPNMKEDVMGLKRAFKDLSHIVIRIVAQAMGFDQNTFDHAFECQLAMMNHLRYFKRVSVPEENKFAAIAHTDWGMVTFLVTTAPGLEIFDRDQSKWLRVPFKPEALVVNFGDLAERWSGERIRSTIHRVTIADADAPRRQSIGYFVQPRPSCVVECTEPSLRAKYPTMRFDDYMVMRFEMMMNKDNARKAEEATAETEAATPTES